MASSTIFFRTDNIDTPFEECIKSLIGISFIVTRVTHNEAFELSKKEKLRIEKGATVSDTQGEIIL